MTNDILTRLRSPSRFERVNAIEDAATEIERLREGLRKIVTTEHDDIKFNAAVHAEQTLQGIEK